jgi:histidinol-phosphate aminotransferase
MDIKKLVKPSVQSLVAYAAKEVPCRVKLDANESPYGFEMPPLKIATNRYPDPDARALRTLLARSMGCSVGQVLCGNGSDELIYYLITTFGGPVLCPTPTFSMYSIIARALGEEVVEVPLDESFDLDARAMLKAVRTHKPRLVFLSTPNNPTGNCFSSDRVLKILDRAERSVVVVDEAYQPFASFKGYAPLLKDYPNMVILRTLSKVGLAALRLGYMASSSELAAEVNKVRLPFNVNSLSQATAVEILKKQKVALKGAVKAVAEGRARLMAGMDAIEGITAYPSEANFILFTAPDAPALHAGLLKRGVLVRLLHPGIKGALRVTVGTERENAAFITALKEALAR